MLQAMNTGHDGSLSTCHANAPADLLGRLETMVLQSGVGLSGPAARRQIASALDLVVHTARLACGSRRVVRVAEVVGLRHGSLVLGDAFWLVRRAGSGNAAGGFAAGPPPVCLERFAEAGLPTTWPPPWDPGDLPTPAPQAGAGGSDPFHTPAPESETQE